MSFLKPLLKLKNPEDLLLKSSYLSVIISS